MTAVRELTDARTDGTRVGQSATDKLAFFGATPVVQQTDSLFTALTAGASAADIYPVVNALVTKLDTLGLIAYTAP